MLTMWRRIHAADRLTVIDAMSEAAPCLPDSEAADVEAAEVIKRRLRHHWTMLAIYLAVVVLSCSLRARPDQLVEFRWLPGHPLPETCMSRAVFHIECPGCGLTRSFISLAQGDWLSAWGFNRTGWLLAGAVLIQFPYRLRQISHLKHSGLPEVGSPTLTNLFSWMLIIALIGNWLLKLLGI